MLAFSLVLALTLGGVATAQNASPPPLAPPAVASAPPAGPAPMPKADWTKLRAMMKQMQTSMQQMRGWRQAERASMLGALSGAHRAYLASVVGALAIAAKPDPKAAAAKIDAMLTSGERAAILTAQKTYQAKVMTAHRAMFKSMSAAMPHRTIDITTRMSGASSMARMHRGHRTMTAGMLLLAQTGFGPMGSPMGPMITMRMRNSIGPMAPMGPMSPMRRMPMGPGPAMPSPPPAASASPSP